MKQHLVGVLAALSLLLAPACRSAREPAERPYVLVQLKTGPRGDALGAEERQAAFRGHFANMGRLARERRLVLAGPYGQPKRDPALRGVLVFDVPTVEEALQLAATDPCVVAGVFVTEAHTLRTGAALQAFLEGELAREAQAEAQGRTPEPGESIRPYVLLTVEDGAAARRALAPLLATRAVLLWAALDGGRAWAVLDAEDVPAAEALLSGHAARLGAYVLDPWAAARGLVDLPSPGA